MQPGTFEWELLCLNIANTVLGVAVAAFLVIIAGAVVIDILKRHGKRIAHVAAAGRMAWPHHRGRGWARENRCAVG